jgi:pyruvate/2-oxoglutarate dehydrogenase complex dihydrolipoamide dehydrogenase (E3) component
VADGSSPETGPEVDDGAARPWLADDPDDQRLVQNVAPTNLPEPRAAGRYHLVVVGGGSAGLVTAASAAGLGAKVALVERTGLGGDCLLTGCVPSKALLAAAKRVHEVRTAGAYGVRVEGRVQVDFGAVMQRMRRVRADLSPVDSVERFTGMGIDVFQGHGMFVGPDKLEVGFQTLHFRAAVLATGGKVVLPPIPGLHDVDFLTHETVFNLRQLPDSLVVVGAGAIGCELAQAFARFGSRVVLIERTKRILPASDADAAAVVARALEADGVRILTGAAIERVLQTNHGIDVLVEGEAGAIGTTAVLVATGRAPVVDGMGLDRAGVDTDPRRGVLVDDYLRTSNPRIWAAGDCAMEARFTHVADATARIVVQNALFPKRRGVSSLVIPSCTYTDPELAQVGRNQEELVAENIPHEVIQVEFNDVDRARLEGPGRGFARVLVRRGTDRILGATVLGQGAGDLIGTLSLAITHDIGLGQFSSTVFPYPTRAEVLRKLGDAWRRKGLTPVAKTALSAWFRLRS